MIAKSNLLCVMAMVGVTALAQSSNQNPNQNQSNSTNQPPRAPGQLSNANAEPTPPPASNPGLSADATSRNTDGTGSSKAWDKQFIQNIAMRGMRQIEAAKIALDKSSTPAVKEYAQKVIEEQGKATGTLKRIAGKQSITIPATLETKQQAEVDKLATLSGAEFDRAYVKDQVKTHERSLRDFQREARDGQDDTVKAFAAKVLPQVEQHLQTAQMLNK